MIYDLRKKAEEELLNNLGPFWLKLIDNENGGFYGEVTYDLKVNKTSEKGGIQTSRILWFFSAAYCATKNEEYKKAATHAYEFLRDKLIDKEFKGVYWMVDYLGNPIDTRKHVYCQSFAIYALSEYYKATKDKQALDLAMNLFSLVENIGFNKENSAYLEEFDREWNITPNEMLSENGVIAEITTNTHLHVLEAYTTLYEATHKEVHKRALQEIIDIVLKHMVDYDFWCGRNQFSIDFTPKPAISIRRTWNYDRDPESANKNPLDTTSYGHNIELIWLLNRAYEVLGLPSAREFTRKFADYTLANGWDNIHGGIYRDGMHDGRIVVTDKEWWQNFESLTGFLDSYQATEDERYLDTFIKLWEFDKKYFYNPEVGESRQLLLADGTPVIDDTGNQWKCIYHTDRAMMECCLRIESLTE